MQDLKQSHQFLLFPTWRSGPQEPLCGSGPWSCGRPWLPPSSSSPLASPAAAPLESEQDQEHRSVQIFTVFVHFEIRTRLKSSSPTVSYSPVSRPVWGGAGSVRLLGPRPAALSGPSALPSPAGSSAPATRGAPAPTGPAASETPAGPIPGPETSAGDRPNL